MDVPVEVVSMVQTSVQPILLAFCGWSMHILKKLIEAKRDSRPIQLKAYLDEYRYETLLSVLATIVALFLGMAFDKVETLAGLSASSAFLSGYIGNSIVDGFSASRRNLE